MCVCLHSGARNVGQHSRGPLKFTSAAYECVTGPRGEVGVAEECELRQEGAERADLAHVDDKLSTLVTGVLYKQVFV